MYFYPLSYVNLKFDSYFILGPLIDTPKENLWFNIETLMFLPLDGTSFLDCRDGFFTVDSHSI